MKRLATIVLAVIAGVGIGWTAGHLGAVLGGAELAVVGVLGVVLQALISG